MTSLYQIHCKNLRNKPTTGSYCRKHCIKLKEKEGNGRNWRAALYNKKFIHFKITDLRKGTILFIHKSFVTKSSIVFTRIKRGRGWGGLGCSQNLVVISSLKLHFYKGKRGSYSYDKKNKHFNEILLEQSLGSQFWVYIQTSALICHGIWMCQTAYKGGSVGGTIYFT